MKKRRNRVMSCEWLKKRQDDAKDIGRVLYFIPPSFATLSRTVDACTRVSSLGISRKYDYYHHPVNKGNIVSTHRKERRVIKNVRMCEKKSIILNRSNFFPAPYHRAQGSEC